MVVYTVYSNLVVIFWKSFMLYFYITVCKLSTRLFHLHFNIELFSKTFWPISPADKKPEMFKISGNLLCFRISITPKKIRQNYLVILKFINPLKSRSS